MIDLPLISVIVPTMRRPARLRQALHSVGTQTYPAIEIVVVNDGGMPVESLIEEARSAFGRPITYLALGTNGGLARARNLGIGVSHGPLIALLDDDDRFEGDHLARVAEALARDPLAVLAYDEVLIEVEAGTEGDATPQIVATCRFGRPYDRKTFDQDDFIPPSAILMRRAAYESSGGFDTVIPMCEDWDFLLRLREHGKFAYVPGAVGVHYSLRTAGDNLGSIFDARRRQALDLLAERHGLGRLEPKTFLDVARDLGFTVIPLLSGEE